MSCSATDHEWENVTDDNGRLEFILCAKCGATTNPPLVAPGHHDVGRGVPTPSRLAPKSNKFARGPAPPPGRLRRWYRSQSLVGQGLIAGGLTVGATLLVAGLALLGRQTNATTTDPECVAIDAGALDGAFEADITGATEAPDDIRGAPMWYLASDTGGLWVSGVNPSTGNAGAITQPLNSQALDEDSIGADLGLSPTPATPDADQGSTGAQRALDCAQEADPP